MTTKKKRDEKERAINIQNSEITIGGDFVGHDKNTHTRIDVRNTSSTFYYEQFIEIKNKIAQRPEDPKIDKSELTATVENIEAEAQKGDVANVDKIERWLRFLAEMADDIFQVTVSALANPASGLAKVVQLIAKKAREETAK